MINETQKQAITEVSVAIVDLIEKMKDKLDPQQFVRSVITTISLTLFLSIHDENECKRKHDEFAIYGLLIEGINQGKEAANCVKKLKEKANG
ncbi:MAG: hypothetical protein IMZ64_02995 [Bacteroidetes bacterium]|nr:hypothetical protein [Bacteroidota bacterium]